MMTTKTETAFAQQLFAAYQTQHTLHAAAFEKAGWQVSSGTFVLPPELTTGCWEASFDQQVGQVSIAVTNN